MGKLALKLHEKDAWLFSEKDITDAGLEVKQVTILGGLCTEVSQEVRRGNKKYAFVHLCLVVYLPMLG